MSMLRFKVMNFNTKLISEFLSLGCTKRKDAVIAAQVYLELCEVKKYWDVECKYHSDLQLLYLTVKKSQSADASIFVPIHSSDDLSYVKMQQYFTLCGDCDTKRIFLALVSSDSTCVYYQITNGLSVPTETNSKHLKVNKQEKLDADIKKNRKLLEEAALCGIPVTIREPSKN